MIRTFSTFFGFSLLFTGLLLTITRSSEPLYFIGFLSNRDGNAEIFRMLPDGSHLTQLTHTNPLPTDSHGFCELTWLPGQFELITSYGVNYEPGDFFCYHNYGQDFRLNIVDGRMTPFEYQDSPIAWSPDGQWKLFIEPARSMGRVIYEMYRTQAGGQNKQVIAEVTNWRGTPVQWSGDWIVYMDDPNADYRNEIYRLHPDGSYNQRLIPPSEQSIFCDQFAIAGDWLIFAMQDDAGNCNRLYRTLMTHPQFIVRTDFVTELPENLDYTGQLIPSPDGNSVAFAGIAGKIYALTAETGELNFVTQPNAYPAMLTLDWSPDGAWLVFTSCETFCKIYRIRPNGTAMQPLTSGAGDDVFPSYSPSVHFLWHGTLVSGAGLVLFVLSFGQPLTRKKVQYYKSVR